MALFGSLATVRVQAPQTPRFAAAFTYVAELLRPDSEISRRVRALQAGETQRHELEDGVFVIEQAYVTKPRTEGFFEAHERNIDVQVVAEGEEAMEVVDRSRIAVRTPYQAERDLVLYHDCPAASVLRLMAGEVAVFHPADVHMPSLQLGAAPVLVRKAVVKIAVG